MVIGLVAWLANREIDKSLSRARASEGALKKERSNLERTVEARTHQLEQAQLERTLELQRFAEFGRLSAGLLHELANPLTAASLNLEQVGKRPPSKRVREAAENLQYLERIIETARKQLRSESDTKVFVIGPELSQVVRMLSHKARQARVKVVVQGDASVRLHGDPVKFSQVAANLIANAIESYPPPTSHTALRKVVVEVTREPRALLLCVQDWGVGIPPHEKSRIFEPLYTTKSDGGRSIGIGLSMVRQIVTDDFHGSIAVTSNKASGTRFTARMRHE